MSYTSQRGSFLVRVDDFFSPGNHRLKWILGFVVREGSLLNTLGVQLGSTSAISFPEVFATPLGHIHHIQVFTSARVNTETLVEVCLLEA